ncbi:MAG: hypothetical protein QNL04_06020 [SAR324 cluster bacterium]|nr:hypothetical protein [SAR324 cluster bacterium]
MSDDTFNITTEAQYSILSPLLNFMCSTLAKHYSHEIKIDLESSDWFFIQDNRTAKDLSKPFIFDLDWPSFQAYFQGKKKLYLYLQKPVIGLAVKKGVFWVFFDPKIAQAYFGRQQERPKDFGSPTIKPFPSVDLAKGLSKQIIELLSNKEADLVNLIRQAEEFIAVADFFLSPEEAANFNGMIRRILVDLGLKDVKMLRKDITDPGASPRLLERRLKSIFRICLRLYSKGADSKEKEGLKTLLSQKSIVRAKALEYIQSRFEAEQG